MSYSVGFEEGGRWAGKSLLGGSLGGLEEAVGRAMAERDRANELLAERTSALNDVVACLIMILDALPREELVMLAAHHDERVGRQAALWLARPTDGVPPGTEPL